MENVIRVPERHQRKDDGREWNNESGHTSNPTKCVDDTTPITLQYGQESLLNVRNRCNDDIPVPD